MPKLESYLHYRNLDVSTLRNWCDAGAGDCQGFDKKIPKALDDILESIGELKYYRDFIEWTECANRSARTPMVGRLVGRLHGRRVRLVWVSCSCRGILRAENRPASGTPEPACLLRVTLHGMGQ